MQKACCGTSRRALTEMNNDYKYKIRSPIRDDGKAWDFSILGSPWMIAQKF
jgi:hypothetical protein